MAAQLGSKVAKTYDYISKKFLHSGGKKSTEQFANKIAETCPTFQDYELRERKYENLMREYVAALCQLSVSQDENSRLRTDMEDIKVQLAAKDAQIFELCQEIDTNGKNLQIVCEKAERLANVVQIQYHNSKNTQMCQNEAPVLIDTRTISSGNDAQEALYTNLDLNVQKNFGYKDKPLEGLSEQGNGHRINSKTEYFGGKVLPKTLIDEERFGRITSTAIFNDNCLHGCRHYNTMENLSCTKWENDAKYGKPG